MIARPRAPKLERLRHARANDAVRVAIDQYAGPVAGHSELKAGFHVMSRSQPPVEPSPELWKRIEALTIARTRRRERWSRTRRWLGWGASFALGVLATLAARCGGL
jgi:hypothetical protein